MKGLLTVLAIVLVAASLYSFFVAAPKVLKLQHDFQAYSARPLMLEELETNKRY